MGCWGFRVIYYPFKFQFIIFVSHFFLNFLYFQDQRTMARFIMYAMCAADEALKDANWIPVEMEKKERTVFKYL